MYFSGANLQNRSGKLYQVIRKLKFTVWKFHALSITQILREINFGESGSPKTAFLLFFKDPNFVDLVNFSFLKVQ